jgi:NAD(P)-dependent dehydrogenase (short-subunit alcohol dehydrogenase family)
VADKTILVVGAAGDVGQGIVAAARTCGWRVVAVGRSADKLTRFDDDPGIAAIVGDISTEAGAEAIWAGATSSFGPIDAAIVAVNAPNEIRPLAAWRPDELSALFASNVVSHFIAAQIFIPRLPVDGVFLGIGGGTADFIIPKMAPLSVMQAAQRMLYRGLAREQREGPAIRELIIVSMVNGQSKRDRAQPDWVTDIEVGQHVCAIIADPERFPGPVLNLRNREQIGHPDPICAKL